MTEVSVTLPDGKGKKIEVYVTGEQVDKGWDFLEKINTSVKAGDEDVKLINQYRAYLKEIAASLAGVKFEDLNKWRSSEIVKLTRIIEGQIKEEISFIQPSQEQPASQEQSKQE